MIRALAIVALVFPLAAVGCASSAPPAPAHPEAEHPHGDGDGEHGDREHHGHGEHGRGGHHKKHELHGGMKAFHDVLAPAYHMEKGPARDEKACAGVAAMKDAAGKVAAEPKGDAAAFKTKSDALSSSVAAMETACGVSGRADVSAKLESVHDAFHALMKAGRHHD